MTTAGKTRLALFVGIVFAVLFMALALRDADPAAIAASLAGADLRFLPVIAAALMLQFWFKAHRWKLLLAPFNESRVAEIFPATVVGYLANLVLPVFLGEFARVHLLGRQLGLRYTPVLATVVLERVFDFLAVLFIVGLVLLLEPRAPADLHSIGAVAGIACAVLTCGLAAYLRWTEPLTRAVLRLTAALPEATGRRIAEQVELGAMGLQAVRNVRALPGIVATSLLQWGFMGLCIYAGIVGTGLTAPPSAAFIVLALTVIGVTLPSSPGFFGTIQLCFTLGLAPFGVPAAEAFAASMFFHVTIYVTGWVSGLFFLYRSGLTLGGLRRASIDEKAAISGS